MDKIVVENLYKIFGDQPKKAMQLLNEGHNKESVHDKTGMTVGVDNASFSIESGEIFVIMGFPVPANPPSCACSTGSSNPPPAK